MPSPYSDAGHFEHLTVRLIYLMLDAKVLSHTAGHAITFVCHGLVMDSRHKNVSFMLSVLYLLEYRANFSP